MADLDMLARTVQLNRQRLRELQPQHVERLLGLSRQAQSEITDRIRDLDPTRFSAQRARAVLTQINDAIDEMGRELGDQLGEAVAGVGGEAAGIATEDLRAQLEAWAADHPGAQRAIVRLDEAGEILSPGLLEHFEQSRLRYGDQAISRMRDAMALSLLNDETMIQAAGRLADSVGIEDWRAERIVRTEQSAAFHRQWIDSAQRDLADDADDFREQLVATFDSRTGDDSRFVDGQTRRLDEAFVDNEGRIYQQPPNRPNDRETVILVLSEQAQREVEAAPTVEELLAEEGPAFEPMPGSLGLGSPDVRATATVQGYDPRVHNQTGSFDRQRIAGQLSAIAEDADRLNLDGFEYRYLSREQAEPIRRELNTLLGQYGMSAENATARSGADRFALRAFGESSKVPGRHDARLGSITIRRDLLPNAVDAFRGSDELPNGPYVLLHESIHGMSKKSVFGSGDTVARMMEEVSVDSAARRIIADQFGSGPEGARDLMKRGAYGKQIVAVRSAIIDRASAATGGKWSLKPDEALDLMADAGIRMRRAGVRIARNGEEHVGNFVQSIEPPTGAGLTPAEEESFRKGLMSDIVKALGG